MEIHCPNLSVFDNASQSYKKCNQRIRLSENRIGSTITCPRCNQPIEVTNPLAGDTSTVDANINSNHDIMEMNFDGDSASKGVFSARQPRCPKCGGMYNENGICEKCGYVEPVGDATRRQQSNKPLRLAGFQLWLSSIATEGVSISTIGYALVGSTCVFALLVIMWGILSTSLIGAFAAAISGFVLFFTGMIFFKTRELANVRNADLGILAPVWNVILMMARWQKWQNYDANLKGRTVLDMRKSPVDDIGLSQLDGLKSCNVLDLENSSITDRGLKSLYGLTKLQCLVLKNTDVSDEAVTMLQQHYPRLWIWK